MNIGSTPTNTFVVPSSIDITGYQEIQIVYNQGGREIVKKSSLDNEITVSGNNLIVTLTQEDTFKFDYNKAVRIQVRIMLSDDSVIASNHLTVNAMECLDTRVLGSQEE